jgi:hypothetical protein
VLACDLCKENLARLVQCQQVTDHEALDRRLCPRHELFGECPGTLTEDTITFVGEQFGVSEDVVVVAQIGLGVLKGTQRTVRVVVLEEIGSAMDLRSRSLALQILHRLDVIFEGSSLGVKGKDHIKRLLHEKLLNLVNSVFEEFLFHEFILNVNAVALLEGKLEPLGAEALLLDEDTMGECFHFPDDFFLLILGDLQRIAFEL